MSFPFTELGKKVNGFLCSFLYILLFIHVRKLTILENKKKARSY